MKKFKIYACCGIDSVFTITASNEEEAKAIADRAKYDIVAKADNTYLPDSFRNMSTAYYPEDISDFVTIIQDCTEETNIAPAGQKVYDVFCMFPVDYIAEIEAETVEEAEELVTDNSLYLFECFYEKQGGPISYFETANCEDCNVYEVTEISHALCVA